MLSQTVAKFIRNTSYEDFPEEVIDFTKMCLLDWAGSAIAGKDKAPVQKIAEHIDEMGGHSQAATVNGKTTSAVQAALVNGASSHIVELDDIHKASIIHAATVVIPAALAVSEWKERSGKELITAIVLGYEVCYRIGEAVSPSHYYYWHNTATCGTFGAAAAVAKLLDLSEEQLVYALGSAGTQASGLWEFIEDGAMTKQLHPGKAAYNGTLSALLAEKDFTAAEKILEGDRGFFLATSEEFDQSRVTAELGERFKITENSFKVHASCRHTHSVIDVILDLIDKHQIDFDQVAAIHIGTYKTALDITNNPDPNTVYASKFSIQFCAALACLRKQASLSDFDEENLQDASIRSLIERTKVFVEPTIEADYPEKWGAEVEIVFNDDKSIKQQTDYPKGDPENPVSLTELTTKFKDLASSSPENDTEAMIEYILNIDKENELAMHSIFKAV
ncbi:MmgE/PrpD family protein [Halobacillus naozhouensis]|uniref:MmgE/PrpD family protein n=1 Tax=Halobacillus naozhouensis TaxID=554880 RepID=A0ABY8J2W8_9BACI|nr:MmgE/PrpD family protein [Halobacillus naozhouensis]WFT76828.1 MmgE/PrpD family protein [Halobacillus naozhouensis]